MAARSQPFRRRTIQAKWPQGRLDGSPWLSQQLARFRQLDVNIFFGRGQGEGFQQIRLLRVGGRIVEDPVVNGAKLRCAQNACRDAGLFRGQRRGKPARLQTRVDGGDPEQKFRRAVDAFLQFVERDPDAARVLLTVPSGDPVAAKLSREVQAGASAGIAILLVAFMPESPPWRRRAATELLKEGLHAVAIWWLANPEPSREELVDLITWMVWPGLRTGARSVGT